MRTGEHWAFLIGCPGHGRPAAPACRADAASMQEMPRWVQPTELHMYNT